MRSILLLTMLISQAIACDLHFLEKMDDQSSDIDITDPSKPKEAMPPLDSLDGGANSPDLSRDPSALEFSFAESKIMHLDCPSSKVEKAEVSITDILQSDPRFCYKNFELKLADQFGSSVKIDGGTTLEFDIEYRANKYSTTNPDLNIYENIRFRVYNDDDPEPIQDRILGVLPGFSTTLESNRKHLQILLRIPLTQKSHSNVLVEFESKIISFRNNTPIPPSIAGHPAFLKINSVRQIKAP